MGIQWAFNSATVMNLPWADELKLLEEFGWRAAEVWFDKWTAALKVGQAKSFSELATQCRSAGVEPIGTCVGLLWTSTCDKSWESEAAHLIERLDFTAEIGASAMAIVVIGKPADDLAAEYDFVTERLRLAAEIAAQRDIRLNLEFLGGLPLLGCLNSGIDVVNAVDHPNLGLLFDLCHYYVSRSHLEDLNLLAPGKLFGIHVDDAVRKPMESIGNEERCFPGEGRIQIAPLIKQIQSITSYNGPLTVELYAKDIWALDSRFVFERLRDTLRELEIKLAS